MKSRKSSSSSVRIGAQLWVEENDNADRIDALISTAASIGLTDLRVFIMWPWMQSHSNAPIDFALYDVVFERAQKYGLKIKATLTANSGPWWTGAPDVLHTFTLTLDPANRPAMASYIDAVVEHYRDHPALGQWVLWNEPINPIDGKDGPPQRTPEAKKVWAEILSAKYRNIDALNKRWRTGYFSFGEVPFRDDVVEPPHAGSMWRSFAPRFDDFSLRETVLRRELRWIAGRVRALDPHTDLCVNPNGLFGNHADSGYRLTKLAREVDVLGASFHAPWSFSYAPRRDHLALVAAGVGLLKAIPGSHRVEVTEMQLGNTFYAGENPIGITRHQIAASFLATRMAGAESSTGWLLNARRQDFEAGEWGLLEDDDTAGEQARGASDAAVVLRSLSERIGEWASNNPEALVLINEESEAVELAMAMPMFTDLSSGRGPQVGIAGATRIAVQLMNMGVQARLAPIEALFENAPSVIVVSHMIAWSAEFAEKLLSLASAGSTVLIDGTSGQFDEDARLYVPWPGALSQALGLRNAGLESAADGSNEFLATAWQLPAGAAGSVRSNPHITDSEWEPLAEPRFAADDSPAVWRRSWGKGSFVYSRFSLAVASLGKTTGQRAIRAALDAATLAVRPPLVPRSADTFVLSVTGERGEAWGVFAGDAAYSPVARLRLDATPGEYVDLTSGRRHHVTEDRQLLIESLCGYAVLVRA